MGDSESEAVPEALAQQESASWVVVEPEPAAVVEAGDEEKPSADNDVTEWRKVAILGKGATAEVSVWENAETKEKLAIKVSTRRNVTPRHRSYWTKEVYVMNRLRHPNVVRGFALPVGIGSQLHYKLAPLAMEYCNGGSLRQFVRSYRHGVHETELRIILKDMCEGLRYLHRRHIIHRDIKPDNIVIQKADRFIYKITDLGYMKVLLTKPITRSLVGTVGYAAPEVFNSNSIRKYNYLVDYWSLGITAFEVATGFRPFRDVTVCPRKKDAIWARKTILGVEYMRELPERCQFSPAFRRVLTEWLRTMLHFHPARRNPDTTMSQLDWMIRFIEITDNSNNARLPAEKTPDLNNDRGDSNQRPARALGDAINQKFKTF